MNGGLVNIAVVALGGDLDFWWQDSSGTWHQETVDTAANLVTRRRTEPASRPGRPRPGYPALVVTFVLTRTITRYELAQRPHIGRWVHSRGRAVRMVCFGQCSASIGATVTRSCTAWARCRSSVIRASA